MAGAVAAFLTACAGGQYSLTRESMAVRLGPGWEDFHGSLSHGRFVHVDPGATEVRLVLSPAHGFILRSSQGGCALLERRGTWSSDSGGLKLGVRDIRHRTACIDPWQLRKSDTVIVGTLYVTGGSPVPVLPWEDGKRPLPLARVPRSDWVEETGRSSGPTIPGAGKRKGLSAKAPGRKASPGYLSAAKYSRATVPSKPAAPKPGTESGS